MHGYDEFEEHGIEDSFDEAWGGDDVEMPTKRIRYPTAEKQPDISERLEDLKYEKRFKAFLAEVNAVFERGQASTNNTDEIHIRQRVGSRVYALYPKHLDINQASMPVEVYGKFFNFAGHPKITFTCAVRAVGTESFLKNYTHLTKVLHERAVPISIYNMPFVLSYVESEIRTRNANGEPCGDIRIEFTMVSSSRAGQHVGRRRKAVDLRRNFLQHTYK